jgi:hypothetical protein
MQLWVSRLLAVVGAALAIDLALASATASAVGLACAVTAAVLSVAGVVFLWSRPMVAAALTGAAIATAFAVSAVALGSIDGAGNLHFSGLSPADSAATVIALTILLAIAATIFTFRNAVVRIGAIVLGLYALIPTLASLHNGGLPAAFGSAPLSFTRGTYAASEILLPLAAVAALGVAVAQLMRRRGVNAIVALMVAFALAASSNLGAFAAGAQGLPTIVAFEHPSSSPASLAVGGASTSNNPPTANDAMSASPSALPSMKPATGALSAPQPGTDYSIFLGPATIDDGMAAGETGKAVAAAANKVVALFGNETAPPGSENAQAFRDADAKIPESEYSLTALAQTQPSDPIALYRFVRDDVGVDAYDGIMRGPLATWMTRAGSPSDKLVLLAWLLVNKGVPFQFVRGTLSDGERQRIAQAAAAPVTPTGPIEDAQVRNTVDRYVKDGSAFAGWASQQLGKSDITLGSGKANDRIGTRHYWLQVDRDGHAFDLDPTLSDMSEGQHLGSLDASFKPWAMLPDDEWHYVQVRVTAEYADGTSLPVATLTAKTPDVAYAPLRILFLPHNSSDFSTVATARSFDAFLLNGGAVTGPQTLDLDAHGGVRDVRMEIRRKDTHGTIVTSGRDLLPAGTPKQAQGTTIAGLTTMLIVPGSGANYFELHEYFRSFAAVADAVATANGGQVKPVAVYPLTIADYFSRDDLVASQLIPNSGSRFYRDRPNIALQRTSFSVANGNPPVEVTDFDIVDNTMRAAADSSRQTAQANLTRGYADTMIERDVAGAGGNGTIAIFDAAKSAGVAPIVVTNAGAVPQAVRQLARGIDQTFANNGVAIALNASVSLDGRVAYGWWDIDAANGNAVGRVTGGAGDAMPEYAMILRTISTGLWVMEMAQTVHECHSGGDCLKAICEGLVATIFAGAGIKHAGHVHSLNGLVAAVAMVAIGELMGGKVIGSMCGGQPGGEGGGGGGGGEGGGSE